ncbi:MAG: lysophospholipase [Deinococcales bacterium]
MASERASLRAYDGLELALYRWRVGEPRAVCLLVHGYAEHAGRHHALTEALTGLGVETFAIDLRGHGRSGGTRADVRDFGDYVADVASLREYVAAERPGLTAFVFGHSVGGTVALRFALEHPEALNALVLSAPFLRPSVPPPGWLLAVAGMLARTLPGLPVQPLDAHVLSRDASVVAAYRSDPLVYTGRVKARMGNFLVSEGPPLVGRAGELQMPVLILHGAADALADPRASEELAAALPPDRVSLKLYPGSFHEILNDLDGERVLADIVGWLSSRLAVSPGARGTPGT